MELQRGVLLTCLTCCVYNSIFQPAIKFPVSFNLLKVLELTCARDIYNSMLTVILCLLFLAWNTQAFNVVSVSSRSQPTARLQLEMKGKGKRIPIDQRGEYVKRQRMLEAQEELQKNRPKGVPIFKVRVYERKQPYFSKFPLCCVM